ncbi:MAG: hypothetical protein ABSG91_07040 [Syntrophobacteraceae bacterium]
MSADHAGWIIAASLMCLLVGAFVQRFLLQSACSTCGMADLKAQIEKLKKELIDQFEKHDAEVRRLCLLVRALAERAGMTVQEQAELEALEPKG